MGKQRVVPSRAADVDEDLVRLYLNEIGRHALLTKDDEVELARRIEAGRAAQRRLAQPAAVTPAGRAELEAIVRDGKTAARSFVNANLRLVVSIAKTFRSSALPMLDLIQEGNLGLMHAVEKFDWRKGFKFSTYATWWIRQAIHRGIANSERTIRLPAHAHDKLRRMLQAEHRLEGEFGREPTDAELAAEAGLTERELAEVRRAGSRPRSLSEAVAGRSDHELEDVLVDSLVPDPASQALAGDFGREVERLLGMLDERERALVRMRFGLDGTARVPVDAARQLGLPVDVVRRLEARALAKLRHPSAGSQASELLAG